MLTAVMSSSPRVARSFKRLDVLQDVLEAEAVRGDQILRQGIKHEGVIGIGRMSKRQRR